MKKHFNLTTTLRIVLCIDILLCIIAALAVLMVNGADGFGLDHFCLLVLIIITAVTAFLVKNRKWLYGKPLLLPALFPLAFISYQTVVSSLHLTA